MTRSALALIIACIAPVAVQAVLVVDQDGGGDFIAIQPAIEAAVTGDEIVVHPGIYVENLDFLGKDLWLHSLSGPATTIIDGSAGPVGDGSCIQFQTGETASAVVEGFTLRGGAGTMIVSMQLEEGLERDNIVGGAIFCRAASPTLRDCLFTENAANYAGAVFVDHSVLRIEDCEFRANHSGTYASVIGGLLSSLVVSRCVFAGNDAGAGDGAIHITGSLEVEDCVFHGNRARAGGAVNAPDYRAVFSLRRCRFQQNSAHIDHGGAIRVHEGVLMLDECLFVENDAVVDGGAIMMLDGATGLLRRCTFVRNQALRFGGHIALHGGNPAISNCILAEALANGGLYCSTGLPSLSCNDAWQNVGGDYIGIADPTGTMGNISADPLFCDPAGGDYSLDAGSPCAPDMNPQCGLVGAFGVGCSGPSPTESVSWGRLKTAFRE